MDIAQPSVCTRPGTNIPILAPPDELDYLVTQSVQLQKPLTPLQAWDQIMDRPMPVLKFAFWVRDAISSKFGVKRIGGFNRNRDGAPKVGDKLDFFVIEAISDDCLVLTERDSHLDVMTSVTAQGTELSITSSVKTHNMFGRVYMMPVGPAHKVIVRSMLNRLRRQMDEAT